MGRLAFLPHHFVASTVLPLDLFLLGLFWSCHAPFSYSIQVAQCFRLILIPSWASSAHFIPLGILGPLYSFGHPWPIPFLHSHGFFLHLLGFSDPIAVSFTFEVFWPLYQPHLLIPFFGLLRHIFAYFPFLIIPMDLLLPSLGSVEPVCFL